MRLIVALGNETHDIPGAVRSSEIFNLDSWQRWLDNAANLTGGLVFEDPSGRPAMHISTSGAIRVRKVVFQGVDRSLVSKVGDQR